MTICVSPEAGWSELETFLGDTKSTLTVAMYQFTAPHIFKAIEDAVTPAKRKFELILHPVPEKPAKSGVKANDLNEAGRRDRSARREDEKALRADLGHARYRRKIPKVCLPRPITSRSRCATAAPSGSPAATGNRQTSRTCIRSSRIPDDLPAGFQRKYNRDYHAIIENDKLASIYEFYIKRDFELSAAQAGQDVSFALPDLFVPEPICLCRRARGTGRFRKPPQLFKPLQLNREVSVQPLLTPDNYAENALKLIKSAKKSVWFQNQYINFRGTDDDFAEFKLLVGALKEKIDEKLDVRIICRDMMKQESLDVLIALGFPKDVFRFQPACHNKTIIVDGKVVMFGSHNWSNEGVKTNRDASLIFDDEEIAAYLAKVYDYDWTTLATAHPTKSRPRVAQAGEATPAGFKRVPASSVSDDDGDG